jgi:serine/threonine protein kinase/Flp pilus assembly protein TadD
LIGKTISHYKILEKIGGGGMGNVYKAEDIKLKRTVALKFLSPELTRDSDLKKRFIQEAQVASALQHDNICVIHAIDETAEGQLFICMEYYRGETLKKKIEQKPLDIERAINIAIQVARGLDKAHKKGIIHRDIKPANVMITEDGVVKIVDFGLAKLAGHTRLTKEGTTVGTVAYMSPEQIKGTELDLRSDIWSLGVFLYEMITGQMPFKGDYDQAIIYSILNEKPEPTTGVRTGVPIELERIINKAISKIPDERYQHADEIAADLMKLQRETETSEQILIPKKLVKKPSKKQFKKVITPVGMLFFLIIAFLILRPFIFREEIISKPIPIAVISFENQTGDQTYDYLRKAIPNLLITNLEQSRYLQVTTWERMYDLLKQMGKEDIKVIDKDLGFQLCRMDGINAIVLGSFVKAGDTFVTDVKVLDVATKRILKSASSRGQGVASILKNQIDDLSKDISRSVVLSERKIEATEPRIADVTTTSMDAYNNYLIGMKKSREFYWAEARQFLEKAIQLDSTFAIAYLNLGWVYLELGETSLRDKAYEKANTFSAKATDKVRLFIEAAYAEYIGGNPEKKLRILNQMAMKYPKEKHVYCELGFYYYSRSLHNKAIEQINKALQLDPNSRRALNIAAYTYAAVGDFEKAFEYLKNYATVSPEDANPYDTMGDVYFQMGMFDEAKEKYKVALALKPDFGSQKNISYIHALMEDYTEAMKSIEQFIKVASSSGMIAEGYLWQGFYHYWLGRYEKSLDDLRRAADLATAIENQWWNDLALRMIGWIYYDSGQLELSREHFKNCLDLIGISNPREIAFLRAYYNFCLGLVDLKQGRIDSAKVRLAETKSLLPEIDQYLLHRDRISFYCNVLHGETLLAENDIEKAITVVEKVSHRKWLSMHSTSAIPYNLPFLMDLLAIAHIKKGELDETIAEYERLITLDPNSEDRRLIHPKYHYRLAKLYEEKGMQNRAIKEYEKFLEIWKNADNDQLDLVDTKKRLANLKQRQ